MWVGSRNGDGPEAFNRTRPAYNGPPALRPGPGDGPAGRLPAGPVPHKLERGSAAPLCRPAATKRDSSMSPRVKRCMTGATHPLERAFDLARTGRFAGVAEIRKQLRIEGLDARQVEGRLLSQQLRKLISEARNSTAER